LNVVADRAIKLELAEVNATDFVNDIYDTFSVIAAAESIELRAVVKARIVFIADPARLSTALSNLVSNAIKFTRSGGLVSIVVNADCAGNLYIKVRDTGIGIPSDKVDRIFERYFQVDNGKARSGFGIGLTLVHDIVQAHGGSINVISHEEEGTTFVIKLPVSAKITSTRHGARLVSAVSKQSKHLHAGNDEIMLVIDDNSTLRQFYVDTLNAAGIKANGFESPVSALAFISASKPKLSMVISDIGMPDMDGYEFVTALRAVSGYETTPIVLVSGYSKRTIEQRVKDLNTSVLEKPVNSYQLLEHISNFQSATEPREPVT
jgi:CheY-like chemotaxis protein/anti-sigma regulatory factor (Ser/Thr protein kinase)